MSSESSGEKVKIGGWLILVGILLWFGAIGGTFSALSAVLSFSSHLDYLDFVLQILIWGSGIAILVNGEWSLTGHAAWCQRTTFEILNFNWISRSGPLSRQPQ